ncbi:MAG: response regulator [Planctomycetota bacterium]|nr:response regulator [Planctomycetota bacterium]
MTKVLVVDDSNLARRSTRKILETAGHEVVEAEDGLRALERYYLDKPDVVVLDVTMKDMDGIEVLKRLRDLDKAAKVVMVTADVQTSTRDMAAASGACGFVVKPVHAKSLLETIQNVLTEESPCN